jgi:hypothetical protein
MYFPHHLTMIWDVVSQYDRRQQYLIGLFWLVVLAVGTYAVGVELLIAIVVLLLLDLVTDPIYRLFSLR